MKRIHMISGPRNISTALMYSFGNRKDTIIVDEPFYGHYLSNNPIDHPGKEETIASMECRMDKILEKILFAHYKSPIVFFKNMAHHFINVDHSIILELDNLFLVRDLKKLIHSFSKVIPRPSLLDIGVKEEYDLYKYLEQRNITAPLIDTDGFLNDPNQSLIQICSMLEIPFDDQMLHWPKGPREEDGTWAKYWYHNVHQSTGFIKKEKDNEIILEGYLKELYEEALPYYQYLSQKSLDLEIKV